MMMRIITIQGTFRDHSEITQGPLRDHSGTLRDHQFGQLGLLVVLSGVRNVETYKRSG
jgi:hypothetical protein